MNEFNIAVLDLQVIESLRALGGVDEPQLVEELVQLFRCDAQRLISCMTQSFEEDDSDVMRRSAHTLKSSSGNLGGARLSQICRAMEEAAIDRNREEYERLLRLCESCYRELDQELSGLSRD